jgi:haloalkane dehalogenase
VIRRFTALAAPAVLGLNLFAVAALYMASYKGLDREVKKALTAPYNSRQNRIATLKFVQDIPLAPEDPSYDMVRQTDEGLAVFSKLPTLICWGQHDFVFDRSYLDEWQRRFPEAEVHSFTEAGHYVLEDVPEKIISRVQDFLQRHPL